MTQAQPVNRCLRRVDVEEQRREYMHFFGPYCADEHDMDAFGDHLLQQARFRAGPRCPGLSAHHAAVSWPAAGQRPGAWPLHAHSAA